MDVGHGLHNLNFDVARKVLDQGLHPDGVSTDGHRGNRAGPVYDLPTTMAKLMALGFTLNQVVEMATANAAKLLGRTGQLGTLRVGDQAEISVLKIEDREWQALDSQKGIDPRQANDHPGLRHPRRYDLRAVAGGKTVRGEWPQRSQSAQK